MSTPMRQQYLAIKKQYPDTIVFFRLGDFYETFDDDAKIVASVCDVVLTSRPVGKNERVPLAGVPYHSAEGYIARLIEAGYKVAVAEQEGLPRRQAGNTAVDGLVPRKVRQVVTPGTVVEPILLDEKRNNYLAAVAAAADGSRVGIAYVDITTGEFAATEFEGAQAGQRAREELDRLAPAELLVSEARHAESPFGHAARHVTPLPRWQFTEDAARRILQEHFHVATLDAFGLEGRPAALRAAGAIVHYLDQYQPAALAQLASLRYYSTSAFMLLDEVTRRSLELVQTIRSGETQGALLGVLDLTRTPMGGRLLRRWLTQPLLDKAQIDARLDQVQVLYDDPPLRTQLVEYLRNIGDLERWTNRVLTRIAQPRDLVGMRASLQAARHLRQLIITHAEDPDQTAHDGRGSRSILSQLAAALDPCEEVIRLLEEAIADDPPATTGHTGVIRPGFNPELDGIVRKSQNARDWVAGLERTERERTGIKSLKVGYNKVFGYYLEVTKANSHLVPDGYIRKQTLVNAERYITPELKEYENLILNADERLLELETRIYHEILEQTAASASRLLRTAQAVAELDVFTALAEVAQRNRYVRPEIATDDVIAIEGGRHPVVELTLHEEPFVPNDTQLSREEAVLILTGPNMAGKSTYLRQVALIVLMAQVGCFAPADRARIGLVDRIFTRIGASDEIHRGQSTFMVEMVETAYILSHSTSRSLIILDEIGRGTSTYDGLAIARAVIEHIHNHPDLGCRTLFATHYHELVALEKTLPRVRNYNVAVAEDPHSDEEKVVFLHKIAPGGADRSYGIHVAQLAGVPRPIIRRAQEVLLEMENHHTADPGPAFPETAQLSLFGSSSPILRELAQLDVHAMSPLEAITRLYDLRARAEAELEGE